MKGKVHLICHEDYKNGEEGVLTRVILYRSYIGLQCVVYGQNPSGGGGRRGSTGDGADFILFCYLASYSLMSRPLSALLNDTLLFGEKL